MRGRGERRQHEVLRPRCRENRHAVVGHRLQPAMDRDRSVLRQYAPREQRERAKPERRSLDDIEPGAVQQSGERTLTVAVHRHPMTSPAPPNHNLFDCVLSRHEWRESWIEQVGQPIRIVRTEQKNATRL